MHGIIGVVQTVDEVISVEDNTIKVLCSRILRNLRNFFIRVSSDLANSANSAFFIFSSGNVINSSGSSSYSYERYP